MEKLYIMVAYKKENGIERDFKVLKNSNNKEHLEYLLNFSKAKEYKEKGYIVQIFESL